MTQKTITEVIDTFSAAIERLADYAPADVMTQLRAATGDLIERFATAAQDQAATASLLVFGQLEELAKIASEVEPLRVELHIVRQRMKEDEAEQAHVNLMITNVEQNMQYEQDKQAVEIGIIRADVTTTKHDLKEHIAGESS